MKKTRRKMIRGSHYVNGIRFDSAEESNFYAELIKVIDPINIACHQKIKLFGRSDYYPECKFEIDFMIDNGDRVLYVEYKSKVSCTQRYKLYLQILAKQFPDIYRTLLLVSRVPFRIDRNRSTIECRQAIALIKQVFEC